MYVKEYHYPLAQRCVPYILALRKRAAGAGIVLTEKLLVAC